MKIIKQIFIVLLHWTWGILPTLVGFIVFLCTLNRRHIWYNGAVITEIRGSWGGISLGMFSFVCWMPKGENAYNDDMVRHEYGHSIQSIIFGPLWIPIFALPSVIWAGCFSKYRQVHNVSYYSLYTEALADKFGGVKRY